MHIQPTQQCRLFSTKIFRHYCAILREFLDQVFKLVRWLIPHNLLNQTAALVLNNFCVLKLDAKRMAQ